MKTSILSLAKELNKQELKNIHGGYGDSCSHITKFFDCIATTGCAWSGGCYNA
jgi:bacteriocin-like protein